VKHNRAEGTNLTI